MERWNTNENARLLTVRRAAEVTGLSQRFLREGMKSGKFPSVKVGEAKNSPRYLDMKKFNELMDEWENEKDLAE